MKLTLFILFFITVFFFNYSIEQTTEYLEETTTDPQATTELLNTTETTPNPRPQRRTTTLPNRVSTPVLIAVPVAIAGATLIIGFGLIAYASRTGGNGIFFLTRTNERSLA